MASNGAISNELESPSRSLPIAGLFKGSSWYGCAVVDKVSADIEHGAPYSATAELLAIIVIVIIIAERHYCRCIINVDSVSFSFIGVYMTGTSVANFMHYLQPETKRIITQIIPRDGLV